MIEKEEEIEKLQDAASDEIETKVGGQYTPEFRALCQKILGTHLGELHVSNVIEWVLSFGGKKATSLPSPQTIRQMGLERLAVAQMQIAVREAVDFSTTNIIIKCEIFYGTIQCFSSSK